MGRHRGHPYGRELRGYLYPTARAEKLPGGRRSSTVANSTAGDGQENGHLQTVAVVHRLKSIIVAESRTDLSPTLQQVEQRNRVGPGPRMACGSEIRQARGGEVVGDLGIRERYTKEILPCT